MDVLVAGIRVEQGAEGGCERVGGTACAVAGPADRQAVVIGESPAGLKPEQQESGPSLKAATEADGRDGEDAVTLDRSTPADAGTAGEVISAAGRSTAATQEDTSGNSSNEAESTDDDEGEEIDLPQPLPVVKPPEDFDWRKLKPRIYGKSLPPLDPMDRQTLEAAIVRRGIIHKLLIDELSNIIDGNTRWEICVEKGIVPPVEMVSGLTDEEKEEEAFAANLARRQLRDPDVERQVREVRLENMFKARKKNKKKFTLTRIARAIGLSVTSVSLRWRERQNSQGENASIVDARRKYDEEIQREAVRLIKEGMPKADVARELLMHPKAVDRAWNKEKKRQAANTATKPTKPIGDIEASDGVPELHRRVLKHLKLDTQAYIKLLKDRAAETRQEVEGVSDIEEMQYVVLLHSLGLAFGQLRLRDLLRRAGEIDIEQASRHSDSSPDKSGHEPDTILRGSVIAIEGDEVFLALPVGGGGVIDTRDDCLDWHFPPKVDEVVRVRVGSFDWKRGLWKLQPVARQTPAPAPGAIATGSDRDERRSPYADLAGRKAGPKEVWA